MYGLFVKGHYCGCDQKTYTTDDGQQRISYSVLLSCGSDFYKVKSEKDYSDLHLFGDEMIVKVRPRVYNGAVYWAGEEIEEI